MIVYDRATNQTLSFNAVFANDIWIYLTIILVPLIFIALKFYLRYEVSGAVGGRGKGGGGGERERERGGVWVGEGERERMAQGKTLCHSNQSIGFLHLSIQYP